MLDRAFEAIGQFSYRRRHLVAILFVTFFLLVAILQSFAPVSYYYADYNEVIEVFPEDDTLVIVYKNVDEGAMAEVIQWLNANERITSVQSYATTLGAQMTADELAELTDDDVVLEIDVYWVAYAGLNPYEYVKKHEKRAELIHMKQIADDKTNVLLSEGNIDFIKIKETAKYAKYFIVEQEGDVDQAYASCENAKFAKSL